MQTFQCTKCGMRLRQFPQLTVAENMRELRVSRVIPLKGRK